MPSLIVKKLSIGPGGDRPAMLPKGLGKVVSGMKEMSQNAPEDEGAEVAQGLDNPQEEALETQSGGSGTLAPEIAGYTPMADKCEDCVHFQQPNACEVVSGVISKDGWCKVFEKGGDLHAGMVPNAMESGGDEYQGSQPGALEGNA